MRTKLSAALAVLGAALANAGFNIHRANLDQVNSAARTASIPLSMIPMIHAALHAPPEKRGIPPWVCRSAGWRQSQRRKLARRKGR